jgi:cyclohexyl-isocyanide hydratase
MEIAALIFPGIDQMDFTAPFEVLSRIPGARIHMLWKHLAPVRDIAGLLLTPTATFDSDLPPLDVLVVPGGRGQLPLMDDERVVACPSRPSPPALPRKRRRPFWPPRNSPLPQLSPPGCKPRNAPPRASGRP